MNNRCGQNSRSDRTYYQWSSTFPIGRASCIALGTRINELLRKVRAGLPHNECGLTLLIDGPALIILSLVCANICNCYLPSSKVRALDVFLALCAHLTDEAKLDRMVPYIVDLLHDDAAIVRASALRTLMQVLMLVTVITPSNAAIFPEYIIPAIAHLARDPEVLVRCMYAQLIVPLADTAVRYLEMGQALKAHGTYKLSPDAQEYDEAHFEVGERCIVVLRVCIDSLRRSHMMLA